MVTLFDRSDFGIGWAHVPMWNQGMPRWNDDSFYGLSSVFVDDNGHYKRPCPHGYHHGDTHSQHEQVNSFDTTI